MSVQDNVSTLLSYRLYHIIHRSLLLLLSLALLVSPLAGQDEKEILVLEADKLIQRELSGGQSHSYRVDLAAGQFLHAVVEQRSIDVAVRVFNPDGQKLLEVDNPHSKLGPESVSMIAEMSGRYRLEVRPLTQQKTTAGRYEIRLDTPHTVTAKDRILLTAEKGFLEAQQLAKQAKTPESRREASARLEENLALWQQLGGKYWEAFTLTSIADIRRAQGQPDQALTPLNRALTLYRTLGDQLNIANTLYDLGVIYYKRDESSQALPFFNEAVPLWHALGAFRTEAYTHNYLGLIYRDTRDFTKALHHQNQALQLMRDLKNPEGEAQTLIYLGGIYKSQGDTQKAVENYDKALAYWRSVNNLAWQASILFDIGSAYDSVDEDLKAIETYRQAAELYRQSKDARNEAITLYTIGTTYEELGENQKALEVLAQALPLHRAADDRHREARTLNYMGELYVYSNQNEEALKHFKDALTIRREIKDQRGEVDTLNSLGFLLALSDKPDDAIKSCTQAQTLARSIDYPQGEAEAFNYLGNIYQRLEDPAKALTHHKQALDIWRRIRDEEGQARTLLTMSTIYSLLGKDSESLEARKQAGPLMEGVKDLAAEAAKQYNVGMAHLTSEEYQKAIDAFNRVLDIARAAKLERMVSQVPVLIGLAYYRLDKNQEAFEQLTSALPYLRAVGNHIFEAVALAGLAAIERDRDNFAAARTHLEAAINILKSLREGVAREDLRISFFASVQDYFELYIDILMSLHKREPSAGHDREAFQASELSRARSLLESLNEAKADIRQGVRPELLKREQDLRQRLNARAQQQQLRRLGGAGAERQAQADNYDIESLTIELEQVEVEIRQESPGYAELTQPQPLTLKEIQERVLDEDTLLLEYALGSDRSFLWAVTPSGISTYELPGIEEIDAAARHVYELLNSRNQAVEGETGEQRRQRIARADAEYPTAAARLSQMLLGPAQQQLGGKRLLIVAQGTLQYIPFGALHDPSVSANSFTPLLLKHEIVSVLSASTLVILRRETKNRPLATKGVAVVADPVFSGDDPRLPGNTRPKTRKPSSRRTSTARRIEHDAPTNDGSSVNGSLLIKRLPYTRQEAEEILKVAASQENAKALDFSANRQFATDPQLGRYRYVHFATHGFLNSDHPELSGIVLSMVDNKGVSQNGFLRAHEIFNLKLPAELVVLSACQTGLGKEVRGEGLVGLTRGFMYAGAPRVVVSLWSVSDRATAELMVRFYRGMLKDKMRPAAALRAAQVSLMKERGWEPPFYWAAFTLQGEWK